MLLQVELAGVLEGDLLWGEVISGFQVDLGNSSISSIGSIDSTPMVWKSGCQGVNFCYNCGRIL